MDYAVSFLICAIEVFLLWFYFKRIKIFEVQCIEGEEDSLPTLNKKQFVCFLSVITVMLFVSAFFLVKNVSNYINFLKLILLLGIIAGASVVDFKKTIIPNFLILVGLGVRVLIYVAEFFLYRNTFLPQLTSDVIGFAFGFGFLFIVSLISRGALGFGDVKLFGVIGLMSGGICTYYTLIFSLLISTVVSVVLLVLKKKGRKDSIPFGPFILFGYFITIVLSFY